MSETAERAKDLVTIVKDLMDSESAIEKQELHHKFSESWHAQDCQARTAVGKEMEKLRETGPKEFPKAHFAYDGQGGISQLTFVKENGNAFGFKAIFGFGQFNEYERFPDPMRNCKGK